MKQIAYHASPFYQDIIDDQIIKTNDGQTYAGVEPYHALPHAMKDELGDFAIQICFEDGVYCAFERYKNAFEEQYESADIGLFEVDPTQYTLESHGDWELVSDRDQRFSDYKILKGGSLSTLMDYHKKENIKLYHWPNRPDEFGGSQESTRDLDLLQKVFIWASEEQKPPRSYFQNVWDKYPHLHQYLISKKNP